MGSEFFGEWLRVIISQPKAAWGRFFARFAPILVSAVILTGCAYRFTNRHVHRPEGIQTIAVEAVYDTSRQVLPHEILWESLQLAFARDGHLKLAPQSSADAIVRAHIKQASVSPSGTLQGDEDRKDPNPFLREIPPEPGQFRRLTRSETFRNDATLQFVVEVEVYNLRTRTRLMKESYTGRGAFRAIPVGSPQADPVVFLRYQEALNAEFAQQAQSIADRVVRDLLVP